MILTNNDEMSSEDDLGFETEPKTNKRKHGNDEDVNKSAKKTRNELYKQPTADELNRLKETENLFNSNIFRLQIEELLKEIDATAFKPKHLSRQETWYESLQKFLTVTIDEFGDIQSDEYKLYDQRKLTKLQKCLNYSMKALGDSTFTKNLPHTFVKLIRPARLFRFGEHANITREFNVGVTMPKSSFYVKDYLNNVYFIKKYFYLAYLMHALAKSDFVKSVSIGYHLNNKFIPKLIVKPNYSEKVTVNLFVVPESGGFKLARFTPDKNNVKQNVFGGCDVEKFSNVGTVLYNSVLLFDLTLENNEKFIGDALDGLKNVRDGVKLLIVWLTQRNLNLGYFSFTNDLLLYTIVYLLGKRKINQHMSSYQVIRIFWTFLASLNGDVIGVSDDLKPTNEDLFRRHFNFSLLDQSGCYNVAAFLNADVLSKVKQEAAFALKSLDNDTFNSFAALFTTKIPWAVQYDSILKICGNAATKSSLYARCSESDRFKFLGFDDLLILDLLVKYLKKGLTLRVHHLVPLLCYDKIIFGINLNREHCSSIVEKGPKQFDVGAEEFKEFWAPLSELRRFKDSSIYEAVYFEGADTMQDKRLIFRQIIKFVLKGKLKIGYRLNGDEMEGLLKMNDCVLPFPVGSNEEATLKIKSSYYGLSRLLRELKLPLPITAVQGISDALSYTEIFPEFARNHVCPKDLLQSEGCITFKNIFEMNRVPSLVSPVECVVQLALHSKWPRELVALRAMKQMFNFEVSNLLKSEHNIKSIVTENHIDILYDGFVFRMILYQPKEISLVKQDVKSDGVIYYKDNEESLEMERTLEVLPKINGALNGIHQESPSFGPSTCLIKRWLRSQMLNEHHIGDVVINLLNAALYTDTTPFHKAVLPQLAFLRFLRFVSETDFGNRPIIVNFNNELQSDELNEYETKFLQDRQSHSALYIVTPYDGGRSLFTKSTPTPETLKRIGFLAGQTYKNLLSSIDGDGPMKYKPFFVPNMEGYDLIIQLKPEMLPERPFRGTTIIEKFKTGMNGHVPIVGFNPAEFYLKELQKNYGEYALFFNDTYNSEKIGVLWKEKASEKVDFKVSTASARRCISDGKLALNKDALVEDFFILGSDLVEKIVQTK